MTLPASAQLPNYPGFLNARTYDAEFLRMMNQCAAFGEGISPFDQTKYLLSTTNDLKPTTGASGLNVSVAAGNAWVKGDSRSTQGLYFCYVDVAKTVTLPSNSSGNPRVDAIILQVADSDASGALNQWSVTFQQGTATVGATLTNLTGAPGQSGGPAMNPSALLLGYVLVPNGFAGPFVDATHILDYRKFAYRPGRVIGKVTRASGAATALPLGYTAIFATEAIVTSPDHNYKIEWWCNTSNGDSGGLRQVDQKLQFNNVDIGGEYPKTHHVPYIAGVDYKTHLGGTTLWTPSAGRGQVEVEMSPSAASAVVAREGTLLVTML